MTVTGDMIERPSVLMSKEECRLASGGYEWPSRQVVELHKLGFVRATLDKNGQVRLERSHYEAVCRGLVERERPKVKPASVVERARPKVKPA